MFNNNLKQSFLADVFFEDYKRMSINLKPVLTFLEEPATYHFLVALAILLIGFANPTIGKELYAVATFFGITGLITYNQ